MFTHYIVDNTHVFHSAVSNQFLTVGGLEISVSSSASVPATGRPVLLILGTIRLKVNKYVIVVDQHEVTGRVLGHEIARVTGYQIYPLASDKVSKADLDEAQYLRLLRNHLDRATLYFAKNNGYDLTNSLQRQLADGVQGVDERFMWNHYLSADLAAHAPGFVTPVIYGYFKSHSAAFKGSEVLEFALLTRRLRHRAGTRYFRRGADEEGNVANFNETEQIFTTHDKRIYSLVQTRGSVPVYWAEINNLRYKPNLVVSSRPAQDTTARHFERQVLLYGDNYLVNLVNQKGYEAPVKNAYGAAVEMLPSLLAQHVKYIYFDFHHECRGMRWHRTKLLIEQLVQLGYSLGSYFLYDASTSAVLQTQKQVVRTNCMDCLDRTNVVQLMIGRWVLQHQLESLGYLPKDGATPWELVDPAFNLFFQDFWADNADAVLCAYSGTGALKTDFTRTGNRTKQGALADLQNSITRYYLNNFQDGHRQDGYDLFLGGFQPLAAALSPFADRRSPYIQILPYLIAALLLVLGALLAYPRGPRLSLKNVIVIGFCVYYVLSNVRFLVTNGYQFVNWPALVPLDYLRKKDVYSREGKFVGSEYHEHENFRVSKKQM